MSSLSFLETTIPGLFLIERKIVQDNRGKFFRIFCQEEISDIGFARSIQQINFSHAQEKHTTKGIHFQLPPFAESKIITCVRGEFYDVAVDLRQGSPTYLKWFATVLSEENNLSMCIPEGFGHGCQSLKDESSLVYLHTAQYHPESEAGINIMDPALAIEWPNPPKNLSERDKALNNTNGDFSGIKIE